MKLPEAVRASDGSKYFTPDSGPIAYQLRGSCACSHTIASTTAPTNAGVAKSDAPLDPRPGQPVQPVQPRGHQRAGHVQPVDRVARQRLPQIEPADAHQQHAGDQHGDRHGKQRVANAHRAAVAAISRRQPGARMPNTTNGTTSTQAQHQVRQKHVLVEIVLVRAAGRPLHGRDRREIGRVGAQQRHQREDEIQQLAQPRPDRAHVFLRRRARSTRAQGFDRHNNQRGLTEPEKCRAHGRAFVAPTVEA